MVLFDFEIQHVTFHICKWSVLSLLLVCHNKNVSFGFLIHSCFAYRLVFTNVYFLLHLDEMLNYVAISSVDLSSVKVAFSFVSWIGMLTCFIVWVVIFNLLLYFALVILILNNTFSRRLPLWLVIPYLLSIKNKQKIVLYITWSNGHFACSLRHVAPSFLQINPRIPLQQSSIPYSSYLLHSNIFSTTQMSFLLQNQPCLPYLLSTP